MTISNTVRTQVAERSKSRCEYCRMIEAISTHSFHVDHVIPIKHDGSDDMDNLAWSCLNCNLHKGADIASFDSETGKLTQLFHPRQDNWNEHFSLVGYKIVGTTPTGRVTVKILQMNNQKQVEARTHLIDAKLW